MSATSGRGTTTLMRGDTQTSVGLPFHTDSSDIVGLLCMQTAKARGESALVSSTAVYNDFLSRRPDLVQVPYEPFYQDWKEEPSEGGKPYYIGSITTFMDGVLGIRYSRNPIETAPRLSEVPEWSSRQLEALDLLDECARLPQLRIDLTFERADMKYLNNYVNLPSRTDYEDFDDPAAKRHLLRMWLKAHNGRRLPSTFGGRHRVPSGTWSYSSTWPGQSLSARETIDCCDGAN